MPALLALTVNGRERRAVVEPHHTLLEVLRSDLGLTGTKECCLVGECGACTVLLDGRSVDSCLVLALEAGGGVVTTVEGLAGADGLDALQQAFLDHGAAQCGFCIPGQLMAARALLVGTSRPSRPDVEDALAGNLCRCAGYEQIIEAVLDAAEREEAARHPGGTHPGGPDAGASDRGDGGTSDGRDGTGRSGIDPAAVPDARVAPQ